MRIDSHSQLALLLAWEAGRPFKMQVSEVSFLPMCKPGQTSLRFLFAEIRRNLFHRAT